MTDWSYRGARDHRLRQLVVEESPPVAVVSDQTFVDAAARRREELLAAWASVREGAVLLCREIGGALSKLIDGVYEVFDCIGRAFRNCIAVWGGSPDASDPVPMQPPPWRAPTEVVASRHLGGLGERYRVSRPPVHWRPRDRLRA